MDIVSYAIWIMYGIRLYGKNHPSHALFNSPSHSLLFDLSDLTDCDKRVKSVFLKSSSRSPSCLGTEKLCALPSCCHSASWGLILSAAALGCLSVVPEISLVTFETGRELTR